MSKFQINITESVLQATKDCLKMKTATHCAIAHAIREIMPHAIVGESHIYPFFFKDHNARFRNMIALPVEAELFIFKFDHLSPEQRAEMDPISFEIDIADSTLLELVPDSQIADLLKESKTMELV